MVKSNSVKKENKEKIMEMLQKAESEEYETSWDENGVPISKKKSEITKGKKARAAGGRFELKVRQDLEKLGWVISKWMNTVDFEKEGNIGKMVPAKRKYNPFKKMLIVGTGFPDFIAFRKSDEGNYEVIGVEVKIGGYLDKVEIGMCYWLLANKIFSRIMIAKKSKKRGKIDYVNFFEKYGLKRNKP